MLDLAPGLKLDPDYVGGGTFALLAKKGAGKTYTARVMAEEMWAAGVPFVLIDPMGAAWGLRSSADGRAEGMPVAIFGGAHGDAPLERGGGEVLADLVVDEGLSMVLDMSELGSRAAEREFGRAFLERLYRRNSNLVHLLVDEADLFAPQKPQAGDQPLLGVTENIVRRGRNRGIGITLITQRPAVLNKDVLTQVDGLVAMRITAPNDRNAIDTWIAGHGDPALAAELKASLAHLESGECWWWVPELDILKRVRIRRSRTFDSSPTKKRGQKRREPKTIADVDMSAIEAKMAATIERARAQDPKQLRQEVARLQRELAQRPAETVEVEKTVEVEVPVLADDHVARLEEAVETLSGAAAKIIAAANDITAGLAKARHRPPAPSAARSSAPARARAPRPPVARSETPAVGAAAPAGVSTSQQQILDTLAWFEALGIDAASRAALAPMAGTRPTSGGFKNNLGALRTAGLLDYPTTGRVALTAAGRAAAAPPAVELADEALQEAVLAAVTRSQADLLRALIDAYPDPLAREDLAAAVGVPVTSGGFKNNLGALRTLELIDYPTPGVVTALPILFPTSAAA